MTPEELEKFFHTHTLPITAITAWSRFEINKMVAITPTAYQLVYVRHTTKLVVSVITVNPAEVYEDTTQHTPTLYINK